MTKEDILDKHLGGFSRSLSPITYGRMEDAIDEFAKQQAIAFARFISEKFEQHGDNYVSKSNADGIVYFTDEIYTQFIEQQNKPQ